MRNNENMFVLAGVLLIITAITSLMLAFANDITYDKIAENTLKSQNEARSEVMPDANDFIELTSSDDGIVRSIYEATADGKKIGYCANVAPNGFGGVLEFMIGFDSDLKLTGIKIINSSETPGLGSKASEDSFSSQFKGKNAKNGLSVIKNGTAKDSEIVAISGATVTSEAIKTGINAATETILNLAAEGGAK